VTRAARVGAAAVFALALIAGALIPATMAQAAAAADTPCAAGTVQYTPGTPQALNLLQSTLAWTRSTGAGTLVAVVDSGIDVNNAHLRDAVAGGVNLVGDGENPSGLSDPDGHGTAIAGEIAARPVAGSGVVGLAPDAHLLSVRVFRGTDDQAVKAGFGPSADRLAAGIRYAAEHGAQVINVSLSDFAKNPALESAVAEAASRGSLVVSSAGNRATAADKTDGERYPAGYAGALGVAASNDQGVVTDDSIHGPQVGVVAPGQNVLTSATGAGDCLYAGDTPSTSFATAYVSAAAALVAQAHPAESPAQWAYRLEATAVRSDPDRRDSRAGWGVIQPSEAITLVPSAATRGPMSPFVAAGSTVVHGVNVQLHASSGVSELDATRGILIVVCAIGATLLGTLSSMIVLRRRRLATAEGKNRPGLLDHRSH